MPRTFFCIFCAALAALFALMILLFPSPAYAQELKSSIAFGEGEHRNEQAATAQGDDGRGGICRHVITRG